MLALLFASFLLTAIVVRKTYTPKNVLLQAAQTLESNLHKKESLVKNVLDDSASFANLKLLDNNDHAAIGLINDFTAQQNIWLVTVKKGRLVFWSGIKVVPDNPDRIKKGYSILETANGYYETIKKVQGDFYAVFFIPIKSAYPFQNQYLHNTFAKSLLQDNIIEIAEYNDKNIYEINSISNQYLFSVKLAPAQVSQRFFYEEAIAWSLCVIVLCFFIQNCCNYLVKKKHPYLAVLSLGLFILSFRLLNLFADFPDLLYKPPLFTGQLYHYGLFFPSLGDFCLNILAFSWFCGFVYRHREKLVDVQIGKKLGYLVVGFSLLILMFVAVSLLHLFYTLVVLSTIDFDVNNVLNLSVYSLLGILMLCFAFLSFYILVELSLAFAVRTNVPRLHQLALLISGVVIASVLATLRTGEFSLFFVLFAAWVLIRAYAFYYKDSQLSATALVGIIFVCSAISASKLNHFESIRENVLRKDYLRQLETSDDPRADDIFKLAEEHIEKDRYIKKALTDTSQNTSNLENYFQKTYFPYLTRYAIGVYLFNDRDQQLRGEKKVDLHDFKDIVVLRANKVSDYFYRVNSSFGFSNYFALIPLSQGDKKLGTLVIQLSSRTSQTENAYPELLVEDIGGSTSDLFSDYSYAFYSDNRLKRQHGKYDYSLLNTEFKGELKQFTYTNTLAPSNAGIDIWSSYNHMVYQPGKHELLVVSKRKNLVFDIITSTTFFFIIFLVFCMLVLLIRWLWARIRILYIESDFFHWRLKFNLDHILYKTRIQFSIVFAVVITLIMVGMITYFSIVQQYGEQQDNSISDRVTRIGDAFSKGGLGDELTNDGAEFKARFINFASIYAADLTLFNTDGEELISTQPKIYDDGLIAPRINGRAYISLNKLHKSVLVNNEIIGDLNYKAGYVPVTNSKGKEVGYLELPYFSNDADYRSRVGSLLNAMINVYALIFIAIGLLAIIIARQITWPLSVIQSILSKTKYGQNNEPIKWKRKDEIGTLINEYNNMIAALDQGAQKLAQSERESAWREMAKQVAHEIKNPLTPLKLGLQLLEKSWRDKDPKFDEKFERFSKSFVEQIESLSSIASEFSAFAKMPETKLEPINVFEVLNQAVVVFKQMDDIAIYYQVPAKPFIISADRDQLLRCFNNLLKNAIEALPQGRAGVININNLVTEKNILLSIRDNGKGIPENLREKIFEPNFTTKSSGTGLGLAFVKNSIENAGGKVWFETAIDEGTTFYISLPSAV